MLKDLSVSLSHNSIPTPFNENDVTVWNALICKFICKHNNFNKSDFILEVINNKIISIGAYPNKTKIKNSIIDNKNVFSQLVKYCLTYLTENNLLEIKGKISDDSEDQNKYSITHRLKSLCPEIEKVIIPGIKSVLDAEKEIRQDKNYKNIVKLLEHLQMHEEISKSDSLKFVTSDTLYKLIQFNIITLFLTDKIVISGLGKLLYPLLK